MLEVLSFGAGVQSTTLLYMSCDGVLPKLDAAIFADTQWEPKAVYAHLERCKEKAAKAGIRIIVTTAGNLKENIATWWGEGQKINGTKTTSIPAFVKKPNGDVGLMWRTCTEDYKIGPVEKVIREEFLGLAYRSPWPRETVVRLWMGISSDEVQRRRRSTRRAIEFHYPLLDVLTVDDPSLLFQRGYSRDDCYAWLQQNGYEASRSACVGCPFHSDAEWLRMRTDAPDEFAEAVDIDRRIRAGGNSKLQGVPYLHKSLIPLEMVEFKPSQDKSEGRGMVNECQGMCGV